MEYAHHTATRRDSFYVSARCTPKYSPDGNNKLSPFWRPLQACVLHPQWSELHVCGRPQSRLHPENTVSQCRMETLCHSDSQTRLQLEVALIDVWSSGEKICWFSNRAMAHGAFKCAGVRFHPLPRTLHSEQRWWHGMYSIRLHRSRRSTTLPLPRNECWVHRHHMCRRGHVPMLRIGGIALQAEEDVRSVTLKTLRMPVLWCLGGSVCTCALSFAICQPHSPLHGPTRTIPTGFPLCCGVCSFTGIQRHLSRFHRAHHRVPSKPGPVCISLVLSFVFHVLIPFILSPFVFHVLIPLILPLVFHVLISLVLSPCEFGLSSMFHPHSMCVLSFAPSLQALRSSFV
jgi:hypothetical protein